ncbi:ABC transporter permease [Halothiobacillus neapolitanus]|uniref:Transport permease protein n=1 Tax=Halothiobacillus neapolitanus (strain ATCC 23641 / DSM 15147 / CIP 104769 / NCIMB 8539 / c2) TaxID=555778 RepID=D0L0W4_HALNC|nr:ABC transporter permease [Halothiobacillus neapolitanus]ACX96337.1 ABC-2 type transporter [Halothiobacillus neapolitanus c2]TDN66651.1 capsular polysaccharide transport system permease protein [Halothiobacillus neapolitanus]
MKSTTTFKQSFAIQFRVIHAMMLREMITRFGRNNFGVLWLVFEPALFVISISTFWYMSGMHERGNISIEAFAATGYSSLMLWRNSANQCQRALSANSALLYHRHIKMIDIYITRVLLEFVGVTAAFILLMIVFIVTGLSPAPDDVLRMITAWLLLLWFGFGLGLVLGAASERHELVGRIWGIMSMPLMFLSGTFFMLDWMPPAIRELLLWIPMVHGVEMLRHGMFGDAVPTYYDPMYLLGWDAGLTLLGLAMMKTTRQYLAP